MFERSDSNRQQRLPRISREFPIFRANVLHLTRNGKVFQRVGDLNVTVDMGGVANLNLKCQFYTFFSCPAETHGSHLVDEFKGKMTIF